MTGYLRGMTRQMAAVYMDRINRKLGKKPKAKKAARPDLIPRYRIKVSVGFERGEEVFATVRVSLNQLKEAARRLLAGDGGYLESADRVRQFKEGTLLPNE